MFYSMLKQSANNKIWFLLARDLSGEATVEEEQSLQQLMLDDTAVQQQYELMKRMWLANDKEADETINENEKQNISRILKLARLESLEEEVPAIPPKLNRRFFISLSAVAVLLSITVAVWMFNKKNVADSSKNIQTLVAENGSRTRTILPDGSTVWLNAGSHISFNPNFTGNTREVTLEGEAYFDVVKQPKRPFIVHVSGYDIRVLGTAFNVKSYPTDKTVETTLLRGLVQVTKQGAINEKPIFIHPNEKLIVDKIAANNQLNLPYTDKPVAATANTDFIIKNLDTTQSEKEKIETAWVYNRLEFKGDNFEELAKKLERWYNITIVFKDDAVKQFSFYGSFETETVGQAFEALKAAARFDYSINNQMVIVSSKNKNK